MKPEVFIVSFPRGGQEMMRRALEVIYKYYEMDFSYCSLPTCWAYKKGMAPCQKRGIFQKSHDMGLMRKGSDGVKIGEQYKYLVLYRSDLILQLEAYFRFLNGQKGSDLKRKRFDYENTKGLFSRLVKSINKNKGYYLKFVDKWVDNDYSNCLSLEYHSVVENPIDNILKVLKFLKPQQSFNRADISKVLGDQIALRYQLDKRIYDKIKGAIG